VTPSDLARKLALARDRGCIAALDPSDTITDVEEAYLVQAELAALEKDGVRGWKVTALTAPEQRKFSSSRPVAGALLGQYVHAGPTCVALSNMILPLLECEVAFTLAVDLPAQAAPYQLTDVEAAVEDIVAVIEIADSRMPSSSSDLLKLADCMSNGVLVTGSRTSGRKKIDLTKIDLTKIEILLKHNGKELERGHSSRIMGNPLFALLALANAQPLPAGGLRKGQIITTGTCTTPIDRGEYVADFQSLGAVQLTVT
jgi:2-keto-4-pentenoate hydratase